MVKAFWLIWPLFIGGARTCDHSRGLRSNDMDTMADPSTPLEECGFADPDPEVAKAEAQALQSWKLGRRSGNLYNIPVYIHVLEETSSGTIMTDDTVAMYVSYINSAFEGSGFVFRLDNTMRIVQESWSNDCQGFQNEYKPQLKVGGMNTLNLYICNLIPSGDGRLLAGVTYSPSDQSGHLDGINLMRPGSGEEELRANTLVHELGHWLGLHHTFRGNTCADGHPGDYVDDTPQHLANWQTSNCNTNQETWNSCPNSPGLDPVHNYMNYSPDKSCRDSFTPGQIERMQWSFEKYRMNQSARADNDTSPTGFLAAFLGIFSICAF